MTLDTSRGLSKGTLEAYRSYWNDYVQWIRTRNIEMRPDTPECLITYLIHRASRDEDSTLRARVAGIRHFADEHGRLDHPIIKVALLELERLISGEEDTEIEPFAALIPEIEDHAAAFLIPEIPTSDTEEDPSALRILRDRAILLLAIAADLRPTEIVRLTVQDVNFKDNDLLVTVKRPQDVLRFRIGRHDNERFCVVRAVEEWLHFSKLKSGPLFRSISRDGEPGKTQLNSNAITRIVQRRAEEAGAIPEYFNAGMLSSRYAGQRDHP